MYMELKKNTDWMMSREHMKALDEICLGLFSMSDDGYLKCFNKTAAKIFGVDENTVWDELHITGIDRFLGTGLGDRYPEIIRSTSPFIQNNISCTNRHGRFMTLNICCMQNNGYLLGVMEDLNNQQCHQEKPYSQSRGLQMLTDISAALSSSYELDQVLKVILTGATASQGLGFNRVFLFMYDKISHQLNGHLAVGPANAQEAEHIWKNLESMQLTLNELINTYEECSKDNKDEITNLIKNTSFDLNKDSLIGKACNSGNWINLENRAELDPITEKFLNRLGTKRIALVPMMSKGKLLGLLIADNYITGQTITDDAVQMLQFLSNQAAVAMEKAMLYDDQRERARELARINTLLKESQDQIIRIEKMSIIGELTSAIAHELRNPLTIIGGFANLILKSDIPDDLREYVNIIASETSRTEAVLDHVLDFQKSSQNENEYLEFSGLVENNLKIFLGRRKSHDVEMSLSRAKEELKVYGIQDQLSHALYQLFYLAGEELLPPGKAEIRTENKAGKAVMMITFICDDTDREKLINALRQVFTENSASKRLTILVAGETIKYHGGTLGVAFGNDGAPSVYVELPLAKENNDG